MDLKKVGKVGILVGIFVANPITGAVAITGNAIHDLHDHNVKKHNKKIYEEGYNTAKAEDVAYENNLKNKLKQEARNAANNRDYTDFENLVISLFAVAISAANCDGEISSPEKTVMKDSITGLSNSVLPEHIVKRISTLFVDPPTFNTAMEYVSKIRINQWDFFDEVIDFVIEADQEIKPEERAFKEAWESFKSSHAEGYALQYVD